jgi:hypothetical protein
VVKPLMMGSDSQAQLEAVRDLVAQLSPIMESLPDIRIAEEACEEANVEGNDYTNLSYEDIEFAATLVRESLTKKSAFISNSVRPRKKKGELYACP